MGNLSTANTGEGEVKIPVPRKPNSSPFFTGRKDILDILTKTFGHHRSNVRHSCLLWGMGGIGKTQICLKFIEEILERSVSLCQLKLRIHDLALDFHMCSGLMPPLLRALQCL